MNPIDVIPLTPNVKRVLDLLKDIVELESNRDRIGRRTNVSAHFEALMNKHEELFKMLGVKQLPPKNAL